MEEECLPEPIKLWFSQETSVLAEKFSKLFFQVTKLQTGIRKHRDSWLSGDNKCWKDNEELYKLLPEGFVVPERDTLCELKNCER